MSTIGHKLAFATGLIAALGMSAVVFAQVGPHDVSSGFGELEWTGTAGGDRRATRFGVTDDGVCTGYIADDPNHVFVVDGSVNMRVSVTAPSDTTLVIRGPDGARCSDDVDGFNPAIDGRWSAGEYEVFVGSYERGERIQYRLTLSE